MTDRATPVVELQGLTRTYPGTVPVHALRPTDLTIHKGDYVAITGRSGSGKSTLLHLLGLLDRPTGGRYLLQGQDTARLSDRARTRLRAELIGFVFQAFYLLPHRTVAENVALALMYAGVPRGKRPERVRRALERVGLAARADFYPTKLSGGERQRVAVARALVTEPALVLADEPTGNLDSATAETVLEIFDMLHAQGLTLIVVTHDPVVAGRTRRRLRIDDGRVTEVTENA